jgi:hypothetical protein
MLLLMVLLQQWLVASYCTQAVCCVAACGHSVTEDLRELTGVAMALHVAGPLFSGGS